MANLKNINFMSKTRFDSTTTSDEELYLVDYGDVDFVVERYVNGANWYRIYKSGWCEQGGRVSTSSVASATINFLKPFRDTNISILCTDSTGTTSDSDTEGVDYCILVSNVTTSSFRVSVVKTRQNSCWEARGYIT